MLAVEALWASNTLVTFDPRAGTTGWIEVQSNEPIPLRDAIAERARALGGVDLRIAASSFAFTYAQTLVGPAVAMVVAANVLPSLAAGDCLLCFPANRRPILWLRSKHATVVGSKVIGPDVAAVANHEELVSRMVEEVLDKHLCLLIERISSIYRLSARVLCSNIAYQCCWEFAQLAVDERFAAQSVEDAATFQALANLRLANTGELVLDHSRGAPRLRFERSNCCLARLVPGETTCDGCSYPRSRHARSMGA
jgi:Ferric iron reductase FhuF-like transporter